MGEDYWGGERSIALQVFHLLRDTGLEPVAFHSYSRSLARLRRRLTYFTRDVDAFAVWHYLRTLSKMKPDVVLGWYDQDTSLVYACQRLAVPLVLAAHVYWLQCPISSLVFMGTTTFCSGPQLYCGTDVWKRQGELAGRVLGPAFGKAILNSYSRKLNRINTYVKSIIACSDFVKSILVRDGFKNVRAIPNGINPGDYPSVPSENPPTVMFCGQTSILKGFPHFLQMADIVRKQFPECRFVFTGGKRETIGGTQGLGLVTVPQLRDQYARSSIVVVPSLWQEPFGLVLLEAMASRKPVVAYRSGAVPEIVADGETGFVVEKGNVEQLAQRVLGLLKDPGLAGKMGEAGRQRVVREFDIRKTAASYADEIRKAAS